MKCIVVDDEPLARKGMQMLIEQVPALKLCGSFSNATEAAEFLSANPVHILFIDIQMPELNGMDFIKSGKAPAKVVITTAYPQFAVDAFELDVADYLVKPIRFERFLKTINRISMEIRPKPVKIQPEDDYIFIRSERKYIRTNYNQIDFIEGLKDYVIVHCGNEKHTVAVNLKTIHLGLPAHLFLRISKSFIINITKVKSIDSELVHINNKQLAIGENYKKQVLDFIKNRHVLERRTL